GRPRRARRGAFARLGGRPAAALPPGPQGGAGDARAARQRDEDRLRARRPGAPVPLPPREARDRRRPDGLRRGDRPDDPPGGRALRGAERLIYLESQFLWSPELVHMLAEKLRRPPSDDFRLVVVLPAHPKNGQEDTRGQLGVLADADGGTGRFLPCTLWQPGAE